MNKTEDSKDARFIEVTICQNPMEVEIFPAVLREKEIPHRTKWLPEGELQILVYEEYQEAAELLLKETNKTFFGQINTTPDSQIKKVKNSTSVQEGLPNTAEIKDDEPDTQGSSMFLSDGLPSSDQLTIRAVWPVWVFAAIPGTGLGHLYAGKMQISFYLFFLSLLGVVFFLITESYYSFLLNLFSWIVDLSFASYYIKVDNKRACRMRKIVKDAEDKFLNSIEKEHGRQA